MILLLNSVILSSILAISVLFAFYEGNPVEVIFASSSVLDDKGINDNQNRSFILSNNTVVTDNQNRSFILSNNTVVTDNQTQPFFLSNNTGFT